ncbi:hypothetical protein CANMA_000134 [Candida margitis]|uniref:uncharacterized protein n=1 Tax=Candida margitis TaxID=1775924 RepID=UPI002226474C|nr:uncharacterized protein CANMA_000134 [Candida margitis]KAI5970715.1 hypothetical protein CANMA_000134 [Candida margitis]
MVTGPATCVLVQLAMYKPTRGRQQGGGGGGGGGISRYFLGFTIVVFAPFIYLVKLRHFKQATINELDLADYVLVIYKIFDAVKLYPQVMVNWMEDSTSGLHPYWLHLQLLSMLVEIIARVALMWTPWADVSSLLLPSWLLVPFKIVSLGIIAVQYYTYRTKQPDIHYKEV